MRGKGLFIEVKTIISCCANALKTSSFRRYRMIYEFKIAFKTIQKEGLRALLWKIGQYFRQMANTVRFFVMRKPCGGSPEETADFVFSAAGGLIRAGQERLEFNQLIDLVQKRKPRVVVETGPATGGT